MQAAAGMTLEEAREVLNSRDLPAGESSMRGANEPPADGDAERRHERFLRAMRSVEAVPVPAEGEGLFWDQFEDPSDYVRAIRAEWDERLQRLWSEDERMP
jgi:hypothetical protein